MTDEEMFYGKCPYTDHPCHNFWDCGHCEVEMKERAWADMMEGEADGDSN